MEVADERTDAGEVVGVEGGRAVLPFEAAGAKLWRFSLRPQNSNSQNSDSAPLEWQNGPAALNAHDLPSVGALVRYLHAAAGFPIKST